MEARARVADGGATTNSLDLRGFRDSAQPRCAVSREARGKQVGINSGESASRESSRLFALL